MLGDESLRGVVEDEEFVRGARARGGGVVRSGWIHGGLPRVAKCVARRVATVRLLDESFRG